MFYEEGKIHIGITEILGNRMRLCDKASSIVLSGKDALSQQDKSKIYLGDYGYRYLPDAL